MTRSPFHDHRSNMHKPHPLPFNFNPYRAARIARLHRLRRKGLTLPTDKASLREAADLAAATHTIHRV